MCSKGSKKQEKGSFVEQMRKQLNSYNVERIQLIDKKKKNQEWFKKQKVATDALISMGDITMSESHLQLDCEISGWSSNKNKKKKSLNRQYKDPVYQINQDSLNLGNGQVKTARASTNYCANKTAFHSVRKADPRDNLCQDPNMIPYLKTLLNRLESPPNVNKKPLKGKNRQSSVQMHKLKTQGTVAQLQSTKGDFYRKFVHEDRIREKIVEKQKKDKKISPMKFQTVNVNSQNKPFTLQKNKDYGKIKRKCIHEEIDIAHEKDILQQLIGQRRGRTNSQHYSSQRYNTAQKFTLKNLLC